jgi:hypothetical protein
LLRKKGGVQLEHLLRAVKGRLFIPEILEQEYLEQTRTAAGEQRMAITIAFDKFRSLVGSRDALSLLEDGAIDQRTRARLTALNPLTHPMATSKDIYAAAGKRSIEKRRPASATDPAYKDCLIWEFILSLPRGSEVRFVSRDNKAFYKGDDFAPDLVAEAAAVGITVVGYREVEALVRELQANTPALDLAAIDAAESIEKDSVDEAAGDSFVIAKVARSGAAPTLAVPAETLPATPVANEAAMRLATLLATAQKPFDQLDTKVLGFVAYLGGVSKERLFKTLADAAVNPDAAKNVAERLTLAGVLRDTGNHFLPADLVAAELAAAVVEADMVDLLTKAATHHG